MTLTLDLAGIRARAEAATPGPWVSFREGAYHGIEAEGSAPVSIVVWGNDDESGVQGNSFEEGHSNAAHIAGMDPPTTLALVDEVERLRREVDRVKSVMSFRDRILRFHKAEFSKLRTELEATQLAGLEAMAEAAKLRARVAELERK